MMIEYQASGFLDIAPGTYDALTDADWQLFRTGEEGGLFDARWTDWLGSAGPSFLMLAPYAPDGGATGACLAWGQPDWTLGTFGSELTYSLAGGRAGDRVCRDLLVYGDLDEDGSSDLLVSGDGAGPEAEGRVWLVGSP